MLHLLDENFSRLGSFETYSELVDFIHNSQIYHLTYISNHDHPLVSPLDLKDTGWRFVYYKHSDLNIIYSCMHEPPIKGIERQAFDLGLDLIEIHHGSPINPIQLPVTADLDIEYLKKEWCEAYCTVHRYSLLRGLNNEDLPISLIPNDGGANDLDI